jgi:hypothetical protein
VSQAWLVGVAASWLSGGLNASAAPTTGASVQTNDDTKSQVAVLASSSKSVITNSCSLHHSPTWCSLCLPTLRVLVRGHHKFMVHCVSYEDATQKDQVCGSKYDSCHDSYSLLYLLSDHTTWDEPQLRETHIRIRMATCSKT